MITEELWNIDLCFLDRETVADAAVIATMDRKHYKLTMQAISLKYDLLLEKQVMLFLSPMKSVLEMYIRVIVLYEKVGTKGEIRGAMDSSKAPITLFEFETRKTMEILMKTTMEILMKTGDGITNSHGGEDEGIVISWYDYLAGTYKGVSISDISTSVDNHRTVFAAEKSREEKIIVDVEEYKKSLEEI